MKINAIAALAAMGYNTRKPVRARVLVKVGPIKVKRYSCRLRVGDGHVLCRLGRLIGANEVRPGTTGDVSMTESTDRELLETVEHHMMRHYGVSMDEIEISDVPGYWRDKRPKMHPGHPLHSCLGCSEPFRSTYTYFDPPRERGRFASRTRTWRALHAAAMAEGDPQCF